MFRAYLTLVILYLSTTLSYGQDTRIYDHRDYGFGELSSNLINNILQDKHGYIWIATEYGLNKFDGVRFVQYLHDIQDSSSISSNHITILHQDKNKKLWIGCSNGLQYYDEDREQFVRIKFPSKIAPHITDIITRADGSLLVGTSGWGIFAIKSDSKEAQQLDHVNKLAQGMFNRKLMEDSNGNLWIATDRVGVTNLTADLKQAKKIPLDKIPFPKGGKYNIVKARSGEIILAYGSQVSVVDQKKNSYQPISFNTPYPPIINEIREMNDGSIFISTESGGLWSFRLSDTPLHIDRGVLPNSNKNFNEARIHTLMQDRENNIWLGLFKRGLGFIPASSNQFSYKQVLKLEESDRKKINSITTDNNNHIWYSIDGEGIFMADSSGHILKKYAELTDITKLETDQNNQIWFTSELKGLGKIDAKTGSISYLDLFKGRQTNNLTVGKNNKIYISTYGSGFAEYDLQTNTYKQFSMNDSNAAQGKLGNDWIQSMLYDSEGLVWLGHHKGLSCYNPRTNAFVHEDLIKGLSEQIILSLLQDKKGNIWVGTYNGLHKINKGSDKLSSYSTNNGLSSNVISGLGEDADGNIWCSTFNGINYINIHDNKIISYYTGDGLIDRSYNRSVYHQAANGKIYFGGSQGITSFYPKQVRLSKFNLPVYITNLYIRSQTVKPGQLFENKAIYTQSLATASEFRFGSNDNSFTIELSTMDFISPENIHYEYRLKGFSKVWNATLPGVNLITYNNLSPGDHELEIRACKFGNCSDMKTISITIMPPWYRSTWAYFVYFILLGAVVIFIANYLQERRLKKLHAYKLQLFTDISHEIRSPLTLVLSPINKLISNATDDYTKDTLQKMRKNANRILNLVNQLLDIRKLESGQLKLRFAETNLVAFVKQCAQPYEQQAQEKEITFLVDASDAYIPANIDSNSFDTVLSNLLSNAFKFTPNGGTIRIYVSSHFSKQQNYAQITVSDSGPGIPEDDARNIFKRFYQSSNNQNYSRQHGSGIGLHLAYVLVQKHHGKVFVEKDTELQGSKFFVQIPLGTKTSEEVLVENTSTDNLEMTALATKEAEAMATQAPASDEQIVRAKPVQHKTNYKVLVVDDEKDIRQYVSQELQSIYKIIAAENGSEAFQMALSQLPDLIISDVAMPDMDGFELVKKIKSNSTTNHIPVILLTAKTNQEDRMQGIGLGADAYLTKPFLIEELMVMAENLIKNRMSVKGKYSGAQEQEGKVKTISFKSSDELLMERIVNIINKYLEDPNLSVQLLADEVGLSRVQLHRKVTALTGVSTSDFIRNIRLKQAEKLLLDKQMNISQVAYALGFKNQTHFSTLFKKMYGLSPSEYITWHLKQQQNS